jgi:hypothetical protein
MESQNKSAGEHSNTSYHTDNRWEVAVNAPSVWMSRPSKYQTSEYLGRWVDIQVRILSKIHEHLPKNFMYIRFRPKFPPYFRDIIMSCKAKTIYKMFGGNIFIFPDCQDRDVWTRILLSDTFSHDAISFFMLNSQAPNWPDIVNQLYKISENMKNLDALIKYERELSNCSCLCRVEDSDLFVVKVDLPENVITTIIEEEAHLQGLELVIDSNI